MAAPVPPVRQGDEKKRPTEYLRLTISAPKKQESFLGGGSFVGGSFSLDGAGAALGSFMGGSFSLKSPSAKIGVGGGGRPIHDTRGGGRKIRPLRKRDLAAMTKVDKNLATAAAAATATTAASSSSRRRPLTPPSPSHPRPRPHPHLYSPPSLLPTLVTVAPDS